MEIDVPGSSKSRVDKAQYMPGQGLMTSTKDGAVNAHVESQERKASQLGVRQKESTDEGRPKPRSMEDVVPAGGVPSVKAKNSGNDKLSGPSIVIKNPIHRANEGKKVIEKLSNLDVLDLAVDGEEQKDKKQKAKVEDGNGQQSLLCHDNVVILESGLSIKGAATRRQWATDRISQKQQPGSKADEKSGTVDSRNEKADRPVQEASKTKYKEASSGISRTDAPNIENNNKGLISEIEAVAERFTNTTNHQHTSNISPTTDQLTHTVDRLPSEKEEQSHIVKVLGSNMTLLQNPGEQSRKTKKSKKGKSLPLFALSILQSQT
ncbi:MAG: hypothetical protein Q9213_000880 [Squamulea squamosa]